MITKAIFWTCMDLSANIPFIMFHVVSICWYAMTFFVKNSANPLFPSQVGQINCKSGTETTKILCDKTYYRINFSWKWMKTRTLFISSNFYTQCLRCQLKIWSNSELNFFIMKIQNIACLTMTTQKYGTLVQHLMISKKFDPQDHLSKDAWNSTSPD